jgi:hypothetical protein
MNNATSVSYVHVPAGRLSTPSNTEFMTENKEKKNKVSVPVFKVSLQGSVLVFRIVPAPTIPLTRLKIDDVTVDEPSFSEPESGEVDLTFCRRVGRGCCRDLASDCETEGKHWQSDTAAHSIIRINEGRRKRAIM